MQQVYQQQMETQASQAIKDAASNQGNNCSDTMTIELDVSKNSQYEDISQMSRESQHETAVNGVSDLLSKTSISNTKCNEFNEQVYSSEEVESCHKAAAATFSSDLERNEYNCPEDHNHEVNLDLDDDDDDATDDDENLDDDDEDDEEGTSHRQKTDDHQCSEECGFCSEDEDSK